MRPTDIISSVCLWTAASASLWQPLEAVKREIAPLLPRQDDSSSTSSKFDLSFSATQGNTATTASSTESSDGSETGTATGSQSGKTTAKATGTSGSTGSSKSGKSTTKTFDARLPAGGIQMLTPAPQATSYYKIGTTSSKNYVTFAWNYTSLSVTPSAVDILATCSLNQATYTLAMNQTISGPTQAFTWDTGEFQMTASTTLLTGTYTLIIHDAAKDVSATAQAGYLAAYEQFTFGMYTPQPYVPMSDFVCATCNAAMSSIERQTMGFMFGIVALTVLSFGWFAGVAGLW